PSAPERNNDHVERSTVQQGGELEAPMWTGHYQAIDLKSIAEEESRLIDRPCTARFVGRPVMDEHGTLLCELPPDGKVTATLEPAGADAQRLLTVLVAEAMPMEIELAGLLERGTS